MSDIFVQDCEQCLQPFYEDSLINGLCHTCNENGLPELVK